MYGWTYYALIARIIITRGRYLSRFIFRGISALFGGSDKAAAWRLQAADARAFFLLPPRGRLTATALFIDCPQRITSQLARVLGRAARLLFFQTVTQASGRQRKTFSRSPPRGTSRERMTS